MKKMTLACAALMVISSGVAGSATNSSAETRVPVLLELFTSEGCSSCPPADRLLETLDQQQPVAGADLIVISEHVDYWNHLGWTDPFSSPFYSARQQEYAGHLGITEVYTPQLVVDGRAQLVGSDHNAALTAIQRELRDPKLAISVQSAEKDAIKIDAPAQGPEKRKLDLYVVLASDRMRSQVERGENAGRALTHVAVAYSFKKIGTWNTADALSRNVRVDAKPGSTRVIVFAQEPRTSRIAGIAQTRVASK